MAEIRRQPLVVVARLPGRYPAKWFVGTTAGASARPGGGPDLGAPLDSNVRHRRVGGKVRTHRPLKGFSFAGREWFTGAGVIHYHENLTIRDLGVPGQ
jgi:hypothetical protein